MEKSQRNLYLKEWRNRNRQKIREQHNAWYSRHKNEPELKKDKARFFKDWYARNKGERLEYARSWRKSNPDKVKILKRKEKLRLLADPKSRLELNLRQRICVALRTRGKRKSGKTFELIGMTPQELRFYLENQFTDGMSWDNYGEWHIDHIRPIASFDLENGEEQKKAFHYTNLQPLWAGDNLRKGKKTTWVSRKTTVP